MSQKGRVRPRGDIGSEPVLEGCVGPVHPLLEAVVAVRPAALLIVGIEHPVAQRRRKRRSPVVADRAEALPRRAIVEAAAVRLGVDEPFVVDPVVRVDPGDGVDPVLGLGRRMGKAGHRGLQRDRYPWKWGSS
jgi:hypothetical protein